MPSLPRPTPRRPRAPEAAGTVLDEIQGAPDQRIPEEILASADCVAVVPCCSMEDSFSAAATARASLVAAPKGMERAGVFRDQRRQSRPSDRRPGDRCRQADHEQRRAWITCSPASPSSAPRPVPLLVRSAATPPPTPDCKMRARDRLTGGPVACLPALNSSAPSSSRTKTAPANLTATWCRSELRSRQRGSAEGGVPVPQHDGKVGQSGGEVADPLGEARAGALFRHPWPSCPSIPGGRPVRLKQETPCRLLPALATTAPVELPGDTAGGTSPMTLPCRTVAVSLRCCLLATAKSEPCGLGSRWRRRYEIERIGALFSLSGDLRFARARAKCEENT